MIKEPSKEEVKTIAKDLGIKVTQSVVTEESVVVRRHKTKQQLIIAIQNSEGNSPCYKAITGCGQTDCCWFSSCQK